MPENTQVKLCLANLESTKKFGQSIGQIIQPDTVLALSGEIGSGKTTLVKAIANGLGIEETVTSPTFVMMNEYHSGRLPLYHIDLYRLIDQPNIPFSFLAAQIEEVLNTESLVIIEWAEMFSSQYGKELSDFCKNGFLSLNLQSTVDNDEIRILTLNLMDQNKRTAFYLFEEICKLSKDISIKK